MPDPLPFNPLGQIGEVSKAIDRVGVPSLISFFVVLGMMYFLWTFNGRLASIEKHQAVQEQQGWMIVGFMQRDCLDRAVTPEAKMACVLAPPPEGVK